MSPRALLRAVITAFPQLKELPSPKLRLVAKALVYAREIPSENEVLSKKEHEELMRTLEKGGGVTTGYRLRAYRLRENLSQVEVARRSGIPQGNISAMERGTRPIGIKMARQLARVLGCDYRTLL